MQTETAKESRWERPVTLLSVGVVAAVAAVVSYAHMYEVAEFAGEGWRAVLLPLSVDGLVVAASLAAWQAKRRDEPVPGMTALSLTVGLLVSVAANVAVPFLPETPEALPGGFSAVVAAWPAVALALAFEQLLKLRASAADAAASDAAAVPEGAAERQSISPREVLAVWSSLPQAAAPEVAVAAPAAERQSDDLRFAAPAAEGAAEMTAELPLIAEERQGGEREAARELVRADPEQWTGKALAERYGKSERWGRDQIAIVRQEIEQARRPRLVAVDE